MVNAAISSVKKSLTAFCKFITANDVGKTGSNQCGYYIPKNSIRLLGGVVGTKGENITKDVIIKWQNDFITKSNFKYYGVGSRNEYRLTRFGRGFPFLQDDNIGDLLILNHIGDDQYEGFILHTDDEIENFLANFNITPVQTNNLIPKDSFLSKEDVLRDCFERFIHLCNYKFPRTSELSLNARKCYNKAESLTSEFIAAKPDNTLLEWLDTEYRLFRLFEEVIYKNNMKVPFGSLSSLIEFAAKVLNRRKSRMGHSLEHHLSEIFRITALTFDEQVITEGNKRPDYIFPSSQSYHDPKFKQENLIFLAAKSTCKERWRQILNEADKIKTKHLFTLQQGISSNQLKEMYDHNVNLVVPAPYKNIFPTEYRSRILTLNNFIRFVKDKQRV